MDNAILRYRKRREKRLGLRGIKPKYNPNWDAPLDVMSYQKGEVETIKKEKSVNPFRMDAPDDEENENNNQGGGSSGGGHGNTRLPFGLCMRFGIEIGEGWGPKEAWDALAGKGITAEGAYERLKRGEDPGTPDVEPVKEPVKSVKMEGYGGAEYGSLSASYRSWAGRGEAPWSLRAEKIKAPEDGHYSPSYMYKRFYTKSDMYYWLKEKGVEEFQDPDSGEMVNPQEMELPKKVFDDGERGYEEVSIGLRGGKYSVVGKDFDGKKRVIAEYPSLDMARDYLSAKGMNPDDAKLSPSLKKREKERVSWLTSDKKEYVTGDDGIKYGDLELKKSESYWATSWDVVGEDENGHKKTWNFGTRSEAMKFMKEQGVEKAREGKERLNPMEYEPPATVAKFGNKEYQEVGIKVGTYGDVRFYGVDLDGNRANYERKSSGETYGQFKERLMKTYGVSDDILTISDEDKEKIAAIEKYEEEREKRRKEFEAKAIPFGMSKYTDPVIEVDSDGDYKLWGYDRDGDKMSISGYGDMYDMARTCERYGYDPRQFIKDPKVEAAYDKYLEVRKEFDAKAKSFGDLGKYAGIEITHDGHIFHVRGYDERGRMKEIARESSFGGLEKTLSNYGYNSETFPMDDAAKSRMERAKKAKELIDTGNWYSLGGNDTAFTDLRIEKAKDTGDWLIIGKDMDGKERGFGMPKSSWDEAVGEMEKFGVKDYKIKDGDKELGMPKDGIHAVRLVRKPDGKYSVIASTRSKPRSVVYESDNEADARKWLEDNNVPASSVKTKGMNPNDDVPRTHTEKTLDNFDTYRAERIEKSFLDNMSAEDKQATADMLTEMFNQGAYRAFRSPKSMFGMLTDHYKSQPEVGHGGAAAAHDPEGRRDASKKFFGHKGVDNTEYEKCGYLGLPDPAEDWDNTAADAYGGSSPIMYTFKKDRMKDRTTYTYGDSLNTEYRIASAGYGGEHPTIEGMSSLYSEGDVMDAVDSYRAYKNGMISYSEFFKQAKDRANNEYVELQFHGMVTPQDIESMRFKTLDQMDKAFDGLSEGKRKKVFDSIRTNGIQIEFRSGNQFADAREHLNKKYNASL